MNECNKQNYQSVEIQDCRKEKSHCLLRCFCRQQTSSVTKSFKPGVKT